MSAVMDTITLTRHDDGTVTADGFPNRVLISLAVLADADPQLVNVEILYDQFLIHFSLANGKATYQATGVASSFGPRVLVAELQSRTMYS